MLSCVGLWKCWVYLHRKESLVLPVCLLPDSGAEGCWCNYKDKGRWRCRCSNSVPFKSLHDLHKWCQRTKTIKNTILRRYVSAQLCLCGHKDYRCFLLPCSSFRMWQWQRKWQTFKLLFMGMIIGQAQSEWVMASNVTYRATEVRQQHSMFYVMLLKRQYIKDEEINASTELHVWE